MSNLQIKLFSGKNSKLVYYFRNAIRLMIPSCFFRYRRYKLINLAKNRCDADYIWERVNYYCKLSNPVNLPNEVSKSLANLKLKDTKSVYFFDSYEYARWFSNKLKWSYVFGDVRAIPPYPSIVKSRELVDNANSILLNLNKVRHFIFLKDKIEFQAKMNKVIFRGDILDKKNRLQFMDRWFDDENCDLGDVGKHPAKACWKADKISLYDHLAYKFIMTLEGNDVASNLKWVMSSNSIAVMPRPTCETWFMEGKLIPNYHYIEIKSDFSDLKERMDYYICHPEKALQIIKNAHNWVNQFKNKERERLISLLVLDKYFRMTNSSFSEVSQ